MTCLNGQTRGHSSARWVWTEAGAAQLGSPPGLVCPDALTAKAARFLAYSCWECTGPRDVLRDYHVCPAARGLAVTGVGHADSFRICYGDRSADCARCGSAERLRTGDTPSRSESERFVMPPRAWSRQIHVKNGSLLPEARLTLISRRVDRYGRLLPAWIMQGGDEY